MISLTKRYEIPACGMLFLQVSWRALTSTRSGTVSVTDSQGGSWHLATREGTGENQFEQWVCTEVTTGSRAITIAWPTVVEDVRVMLGGHLTIEPVES